MKKIALTSFLVTLLLGAGLWAAASMQIPAAVEVLGNLTIGSPFHLEIRGSADNLCISNGFENTLFVDIDCDNTLDPGDIDLAASTTPQIDALYPMTPATCQGTTAYLAWNTVTGSSPAATCVTGTNTQQAYADFDQTVDECMQAHVSLPTDWTGEIDADYKWLTTATSGSVAWCTQLACVADAETGDPAFIAQGSGNCVSDTAKGTTNQFNDVSDLAITDTGCVAGEHVYVRTCRDPDETGGQTDTVAADARLIDMTLTVSRTP